MGPARHAERTGLGVVVADAAPAGWGPDDGPRLADDVGDGHETGQATAVLVARSSELLRLSPITSR